MSNICEVLSYLYLKIILLKYSISQGQCNSTVGRTWFIVTYTWLQFLPYRLMSSANVALYAPKHHQNELGGPQDHHRISPHPEPLARSEHY